MVQWFLTCTIVSSQVNLLAVEAALAFHERNLAICCLLSEN
jgi:hypothetical protein